MGFDLRYGDFRLRPLTVADAAMTMAWRNQPSIRASMYTDHEIRLDEHTAWIGRATSNDTCSYHICEYRGRPIGSVGFYAIERRHGRGEWTFYIGEPDAVRGSGGAMLFMAADHFFDGLGLSKLCGDAISSNPRSARLHENLGFELEGVRLRHLRRGDKMLDVRLYALFADKWKSARQQQFSTLFSAR